MTNAELKQQAIELVGEEELSRRFRLWITGLIKKERAKGANLSNDALFLNEAASILEDLNKRTKSKFRMNDTTLAMIRERMREGWMLEDFIKVHEVKCAKWLGKESFEDNLRPSTLYRKSHFGEYHAEWYAWQGKQEAQKPAVKPGTSFNTEESREKQRKAEEAKNGTIAKLLAKRWWEFESWADFMKWTVQFPDAQSLAKYEMPERIRKMRTAPGMVMKVLKGQSPDWAENEYLQHREKQRKD